ncbi:MAG: sarcosine oxidase subunit delta [Gammaproteobacteria bacterium]
MKILNCPLNGPRNISEFICFGEVTNMPNPKDMNDEQWADFMWMSNNTAGVVQEWWCHAATSYWFIAERNTITDEILKTYPANEVFSERVDF